MSLALFGLAAGSVWADPVLDFSSGGAQGGQINYAGGASPLTGANIPIKFIGGGGTPMNDGATLSVYGTYNTTTHAYGGTGLLSFSTGPLVSYNPTTKLFTFGGSGSISITGYVPVAGITTKSTLLSGSFIGGTFSAITSSLRLFVGTGTDTKNPALVSYFFATPPASWTFGGTITTGNPTLVANNAFRNAIGATSVDITNTAPIPEVSSLFLLSAGLLGTMILVRRRSQSEG